jgi:hypothetical protein
MRMRFKINFNRALVMSTLWHMLCFFMVTIVVLPVGARQKRLSDVYFLGTLLERNTLNREFTSAEEFSRRRTDITAISPVINKASGRVDFTGPLKTRDYMLKRRDHVMVMDSITQTEKIIPNMIEEGLHRQDASFEFQIEGPAGQREIASKPPLPDNIKSLINGRDNLLDDYSFIQRISIAGNGEVSFLDMIELSDYPETDLLLREYIKKWRFVSLGDDMSDQSSEGTIRVIYTSKKTKKLNTVNE